MTNDEKTIRNKIFYRTTEAEVLKKLKQNPANYRRYLSLDGQWREHFMAFCTGRKTLPLLYDTIFKKVFNPEAHPERLESLLSHILGQKVKIKRASPTESIFADGKTIVVMDILVELSDGSLVLVEIQKVPYNFPIKRAACYVSEILTSQYIALKNKYGANADYRDLKTVYSVLFFEKSPMEFKKDPSTFLYHSHLTTNGIHLPDHSVGAPLDFFHDFPMQFYFVALDKFKKSGYAKHKDKDDTLAGWLHFLCTENADDAVALCQTYPWLTDIYLEMAEYRQNPEEVLSMYYFSAALRELDANTIANMIKEQKAEIEEQKEKIEELDKVIKGKNASLAEKNASLAEKDTLLAEKDSLLAESAAEIARLREELSKRN